MTRMKTTARIATMMAAVAVTAACSDRAERNAEVAAREGGNAATEAAKDVGNAARDTGQAAADAVMQGGRAADAAVETMDVKMALTADSRVDASNINVDSDHVTKTVTLKGRVPTEAQKALAGDIAKAKATGYSVRNTLVVGQ